MKSSYKLILLLLMTAFVMPVCAQKMILGKSPKTVKPRIHPYEQLLSMENSHNKRDMTKSFNNRLLVIMVDFLEETVDDPLTTGNGKFELVANPAYKTTIGSPPHNHDYYIDNLEALRYYYKAVSQGGFDIQYDLYPQDKIAYTLPQTMGYYSPPGATGDLFLSRIEEYFKNAFETADADDPEIDFSQYDHFMIIHAGSDWQHDVVGDTPSDLPSYFINIADGKEAVVDNGAVSIYQACNVPSTISQDFSSYEENGITYDTGYGALNGVFAHEFGHSVGFVDLYNTYNFNPEVGQFDIMDSGGSGVSVDTTGVANEYVLIEGVQPCLPGAFSTMLAFGDNFEARGLVKDINQIDLYTDLHLSASSRIPGTGSVIPTIYKIPLNANEYILVENRSVDPDGDGGTAVHPTADRRVILYPTSLGPSDEPTYEYDYLLPSFITPAGGVAGGGMIVWHIDDSVIYGAANPPVLDEQGHNLTNFANNTVNGRYSRRGVQILEADGLEDIGNDYSWFWTGTPYEYFHTYKPVLDEQGLFVNWSTQLWRPALNADTTPSLKDTESNNPSFYGLKDISQPQGIMIFQVSAGRFDNVISLGIADTSQIVLPIMKTSIADLVLPVMRGNNLKFYAYDASSGYIEFAEVTLPSSLMTQKPVLATFGNDIYPTLILTLGSKIYFVKIANDAPETAILHMETHAVNSPIFANGKLYAFSQDKCYFTANPFDAMYFSFDVQVAGALNAANGLTWMENNQLNILNDITGTITKYTIANDTFSGNKYESVYGNHTYFITSDRGNIYAFNDQTHIANLIFRNETTVKPTQIALCSLYGAGPAVVFGVNDRIYAIDRFGTMLPGFPHYYEKKTFTSYSFPKVIWADETEVLLMPLDAGGYLAINQDGSINNGFSLPGQSHNDNDILYADTTAQALRWFFIDNEHILKIASVNDMSDFAIVWNGFRNQGNGCWSGAYQTPPETVPGFNAYIYPNPVTTDILRIRVKDFTSNVKISVYDISGKKVQSLSYPANGVTERDFLIDVSKLSSAVYLAIVQDDKHTKKLKFALEK